MRLIAYLPATFKLLFFRCPALALLFSGSRKQSKYKVKAGVSSRGPVERFLERLIKEQDRSLYGSFRRLAGFDLERTSCFRMPGSFGTTFAAKGGKGFRSLKKNDLFIEFGFKFFDQLNWRRVESVEKCQVQAYKITKNA